MENNSPRNVWKTNCKNAKCHQCIASWKRKSNKHAYNASRTKYALMCFLEGNTEETPVPGAEGPMGPLAIPIPLQEDPVFTGTEDEIKKKENENKLFICGICQESQVKQGRRKPIIYQCGHTNCAECYNGMLSSGRTMACPYCRADIEKAVRLFVD